MQSSSVVVGQVLLKLQAVVEEAVLAVILLAGLMFQLP